MSAPVCFPIFQGENMNEPRPEHFVPIVDHIFRLLFGCTNLIKLNDSVLNWTKMGCICYEYRKLINRLCETNDGHWATRSVARMVKLVEPQYQLELDLRFLISQKQTFFRYRQVWNRNPGPSTSTFVRLRRN